MKCWIICLLCPLAFCVGAGAQVPTGGASAFEQPFGCSLAEYVQGDVEIHFVGAYQGRETALLIDDSKHQATQIDVLVNRPGRKVALLLGAYEPNVWNIGWTAGTQIVAVAATGYHRQLVTGIEKDTPTVISTSDNGVGCGMVHEAKEKLAPMAQKVFARPVTQTHTPNLAVVMIGPVIRNNASILTSATNTPASYVDKSAPRPGQDGLDDAVKAGLIRRATADDMTAWLEVQRKKYEPEKPTYRAESAPRNSYVVLKAFTYPPGLSNSATFFIQKGVPHPTGFKAYCTVYDFNTGEAE